MPLMQGWSVHKSKAPRNSLNWDTKPKEGASQTEYTRNARVFANTVWQS